MGEVQKPTSAWYNFRTGEYDHLPEAPEDFSDYVEQGAARSLYLLYVQIGFEPIQAAIKVLSFKDKNDGS